MDMALSQNAVNVDLNIRTLCINFCHMKIKITRIGTLPKNSIKFTVLGNRRILNKK